MPAQPWPTPEQWSWLTQQQPAAQEVRLTSRYTTWLNETCHKRLFGEAKKLTPEQEDAVAKAVKARRAQLGTWFNNHRTKTHANGYKRALHVREVWCREFYDGHRATVEATLAARRTELGHKPRRQETLSITRTEIDRQYSLESPEVKADVFRRWEEEKAVARATPEKVAGQDHSPEQYQQYVVRRAAGLRAHTSNAVRLTTRRFGSNGPWLLSLRLQDGASQLLPPVPFPENDGEMSSIA
ncbi:hypothetical protein PYCCODRAFT_1448553 [Trametes coccinea BRFM310]|uniref:Uncharacterized protein n=1 Tax=Trametes coccinea (strain BRFM310) TaxID=1353009 RepID=A0A1Y2I8T2_TRAC3|nr:hypothetical protein PYCCODRAFT_1448553 [Trametes coccinea BRFM310]